MGTQKIMLNVPLPSERETVLRTNDNHGYSRLSLTELEIFFFTSTNVIAARSMNGTVHGNHLHIWIEIVYNLTD